MAKTTESVQQPEQPDSVQVIPLVVVEDTEILQQTNTIVVFKVSRPMLKREYEELSARVRAENEISGLRVVLAPSIVDGVEINEDETGNADGTGRT